MRTLTLSTALLAAGLAACNSYLDEQPVDSVPVSEVVNDSASANAAIIGAYNSLQSGSYYGGDFLFFNELSSDNAQDVGTFNSYKDAEAHNLKANNGTISDIWAAIYSAINRTNVIIQGMPNVKDLSTQGANQILGEAYMLRALHYHNLVKLFGGVPLRLVPATSIEDANSVVRADSNDVYTQIFSDLQAAETLMTANSDKTRATVGAAKALLARVYLYKRDWANANAKADEVMGMGYTLEPTYANLFDAEGLDTPEDIFKVTFTDVVYQYMYYWIDGGGGYEVAPTQNLVNAFNPTDVRFTWDIYVDNSSSPPVISGYKYPTTYGTEDIHVIRFAEVLLIKAEALAQMGQLSAAVDQYNLIRQRAGLLPHVFGVDVTTQQQVLDEIDLQRRLELCMEGDRWADLLRTGRWQTALPAIPVFQTLYPIPQSERDVAHGLTQNPGY
jgi:hypothetical protein